MLCVCWVKKYVSIDMKNDLAMCLRILVLCLCGVFVNIVAVEQPFLHCGSCILRDPHYYNNS